MKDVRHIPLILFSIAVMKVIVLGASYQDALVLVVLGAVSAFYEFKSQDKVIKEMKEIQDKQAQVALALAKSMDELKSNMSAIKISQGMKTTNVGRI